MKALRMFTFLLVLFMAVSCDKDKKAETSNKTSIITQKAKQTYLLFVRIPDPVMPLERGEKYEDPLDEFLKAEGLGEVTGGGSMLSEPDAEGKRSIAWVGVDVDVYDPDKAMPKLIRKLQEIGVPAGTEIEQSQPVERTIKVN